MGERGSGGEGERGSGGEGEGQRGRGGEGEWGSGGEGVGKMEREKITFVFVLGTSACETSGVSNSPSRDDGGIVVRSEQGHYHVSVSQCLDGVASTLLTGCVETHQQLCPWTR